MQPMALMFRGDLLIEFKYVSVVVCLLASVVVRAAASLQYQICHRDVWIGRVTLVLSWHHVWSKQECRFA